MVTSIRYWMRVFDLLEGNDQTNKFADYLFGEEGKTLILRTMQVFGYYTIG
ncbi:MAG: hypothetical protein IPK76_09830 [Lewinellaceae bacterium]|nr:hypothetical protein [Lewinellaceae bacterium]